MSPKKSTYKQYTRISIALLLLIPIFLAFNSTFSEETPFNTGLTHVNTEKFSGEWYVISNIPYFAENGKVATKTTYTRRDSNLFDDVFESKDGSFNKPTDRVIGKAKSLNKENTKWKSTFYWFISFEYEILYVDQGYNIMLLGHNSRDYGWLMSRTKTVSQNVIDDALTVFESQGYDITKFALVPQTAEQLTDQKVDQSSLTKSPY